MTYTYIGDRLTDPRPRGQPCEAVRNSRGKCVNVIGRLLRKQPQQAAQSGGGE